MIIVFNPVRTHVEILFLLKNYEVKVCFTCSKHIEDKSLINKLLKLGIEYFIYSNKLIVENSVLIPCDDESARLVDVLNIKNNSKTSNSLNELNLRLNKKEYLSKLNNDILSKIEIPCVIKPIKSAGGENTFFIKTTEDISSFLRKNIKINDMIIQKYYEGTEYSVDIISKDGIHYLVGIWRYKKISPYSTVRESIELLRDTESDIVNNIYEYMKNCLNAVGNKNGASHSEIIYNEKNIYLLEINFRFHGHITHNFYSKGTGDSHFSAYIKKFITNESIPLIYESKNNILKILINLDKKLFLPNINYKIIENLDSVLAVIKHPSTNYNKLEYGPTVDVKSALCYVLLYDNNTTYLKDLNVIENWKNQLYYGK